MADQLTSLENALERELVWLRNWLENLALPLWWALGADRRYGGFYERIAQNGTPMLDDARRARVPPRQIYCYALAGLNGWDGPWREAVEHGLSGFETSFKTKSGLYAKLCNSSCQLIDKTIDLYDQTFALLANAAVSRVLEQMRPEMLAKSHTVLSALNSDYRHPKIGYEESIPPSIPLRANPHMHLLEAMLAWNAVDPSGPWGALADELAVLAMDYLMDRELGAIREYFDHDWRPFAYEKGRLIEPGHQFEWAWLFIRWGELRKHDQAIAVASTLFDFAEKYGICSRRNVVMMAILDDCHIHDGVARLWSQTEWLKAAVHLAGVTAGVERHRYMVSAYRAAQAIKLFLATERAGLWFDKWPEDGPIIDEPAPASTFYHLVGAIYDSSNSFYSRVS